MTNQVFDIGNIVSFCSVESNNAETLRLVTSKSLKRHEDIYIIDHMWTFNDELDAREQLLDPSLAQRVASIVDIEEIDDVNAIMKKLWLIIGNYNIVSNNGKSTRKFYFVLDEVGSR